MGEGEGRGKQGERMVSLPVGVVIRRMPGVTKWAKWSWRAVAVLPGAGPADWAEMRRDGDAVEYHMGTTEMELWRTDTEAYRVALSTEPASVYVILREGDGEHPLDLIDVTASPFEAQDHADTGEDIVEPVAMPPGLIAFVREFVERHHEDEVFVKRRRDRKRTDLTEDGIGDARVRQMADVYRSPASRKGRLQ